MKNKMKTVKLKVSGDVQRVGYRSTVSRIARKYEIEGSVQNLEDETVQIIAQGTETKLKKFKQEIFIQDWPIQVEEIQEQETVQKELFTKFKIIRGDAQQEMAERADVAAAYLQKIADITAKETTLQEFRKEASKETTLEKFRNEASKEATSAKEKTLTAFRQEAAKEETLQSLIKITAKEETLQKAAKEETLKQFSQGTDTEFKDLDVKYGSISKKLDKLDNLELVADKLDKLSNAILELALKK